MKATILDQDPKQNEEDAKSKELQSKKLQSKELQSKKIKSNPLCKDWKIWPNLDAQAKGKLLLEVEQPSGQLEPSTREQDLSLEEQMVSLGGEKVEF